MNHKVLPDRIKSEFLRAELQRMAKLSGYKLEEFDTLKSFSRVEVRGMFTFPTRDPIFFCYPLDEIYHAKQITNAVGRKMIDHFRDKYRSDKWL